MSSCKTSLYQNGNGPLRSSIFASNGAATRPQRLRGISHCVLTRIHCSAEVCLQIRGLQYLCLSRFPSPNLPYRGKEQMFLVHTGAKKAMGTKYGTIFALALSRRSQSGTTEEA